MDYGTEKVLDKIYKWRNRDFTREEAIKKLEYLMYEYEHLADGKETQYDEEKIKSGMKLIKRYSKYNYNELDKEYVSERSIYIDYRSDNCEHCGGGGYEIVLFKYNKQGESGWYVIEHWCGCQTYDESYASEKFDTHSEAKEYYDRKLKGDPY